MSHIELTCLWSLSGAPALNFVPAIGKGRNFHSNDITQVAIGSGNIKTT